MNFHIAEAKFFEVENHQWRRYGPGVCGVEIEVRSKNRETLRVRCFESKHSAAP